MFSAFGFGMLEKLATNSSDIWGTGNKLRDTQREENMDDYLQRERMGIQARVEGAKAAGLHPLVAMNYQGGNSPSTLVGGSQLPNSSGYQRVAAEKPDPTAQRINEANARIAEANADKAELDTHIAYRNLATQPGNGPGIVPDAPAKGSSLPTEPGNRVSANKLKAGVVVKPDEVVSSVGGITSAQRPGMTVYNVPGVDGSILLPSNDLSQSLEDDTILKSFLTFMANMKRHDLLGLEQQRFRSNLRNQRTSEERERVLEEIRLRNRSRAKLGY